MSRSVIRKKENPVFLSPVNDKLESYHKALLDPNKKAIVVLGHAGTGKTITWCQYAALAYKQGLCAKFVILRPNVGCGEDIGFLPGSEFEKTYPFHVQTLKYLAHFFQMSQEDLVGDGIVEIQSFYTLQGRDLAGAWVFVDESQNLTVDEMYILVTRGADKFVCCGDTNPAQVLGKNVDDLNNGLAFFFDTMGDLPYVEAINFDKEEYILRSGIVKDAIIRMAPRIAELKQRK